MFVELSVPELNVWSNLCPYLWCVNPDLESDVAVTFRKVNENPRDSLVL
jgi:hypothetical protein